MELRADASCEGESEPLRDPEAEMEPRIEARLHAARTEIELRALEPRTDPRNEIRGREEASVPITSSASVPRTDVPRPRGPGETLTEVRGEDAMTEGRETARDPRGNCCSC